VPPAAAARHFAAGAAPLATPAGEQTPLQKFMPMFIAAFPAAFNAAKGAATGARRGGPPAAAAFSAAAQRDRCMTACRVYPSTPCSPASTGYM
jgi:hypothetical protein